jgi:hypothetical protein
MVLDFRLAKEHLLAMKQSNFSTQSKARQQDLKDFLYQSIIFHTLNEQEVEEYMEIP